MADNDEFSIDNLVDGLIEQEGEGFSATNHDATENQAIDAPNNQQQNFQQNQSPTQPAAQQQPAQVPDGQQSTGAPTQGNLQQTQIAQPGQNTQGQPPQQFRTDIPPRLQPDAQGNLVDASGKIVATKGAHRRHYEELQGARRDVATISQSQQALYRENTELRQRIQEVEQQGQVHERFGLSQEEMMQGLGFVTSYKTQPVQLAQQMLTDLAGKGYDIRELLSQFVAVDQNGNMVLSPNMPRQQPQTTQHMNPQMLHMQQQQQQQITQERIQQQARDAANAFLNNPAYQYARTHEDVITRMVTQDRALSPEAAYTHLQAYAFANGLDFTQPLGPQIQAKQNGMQTQPHQNSAPGFNMGQGNASVQDLNTPKINSADDSPANIVRQAMLDNGMIV